MEVPEALEILGQVLSLSKQLVGLLHLARPKERHGFGIEELQFPLVDKNLFSDIDEALALFDAWDSSLTVIVSVDPTALVKHQPN